MSEKPLLSSSARLLCDRFLSEFSALREVLFVFLDCFMVSFLFIGVFFISYLLGLLAGS